MMSYVRFQGLVCLLRICWSSSVNNSSDEAPQGIGNPKESCQDRSRILQYGLKNPTVEGGRGGGNPDFEEVRGHRLKDLDGSQTKNPEKLVGYLEGSETVFFFVLESLKLLRKWRNP